MATAPECITRFEHEGIFAASPERMGRALREGAPGSWPASPIGGGSASPHVTPIDLANFLIAQTGFVPSGATNALAALHDLPLLHYDRQRIRGWSDTSSPPAREAVPRPPFASLGEAIEIAIDAGADPARRDALTHLTLLMCAVDPAWARLEWQRDNYMNVAEFRRIGGLGQQRGEHVECVVRIPRRVFAICWDLWTDTKAKLAAKDENAAALAGATAPSKAPTARQRQAPSRSDASVRVRAPATAGEPRHARRRRHSPIGTSTGAT
jgi:hypothetical protein